MNLLTGFEQEFLTAAQTLADPVAFVEKYDAEKRIADPWQAKILRSTGRNIIVSCGRQTGKTHTIGWKAAHHAASTRRGKAIFLSKTERQSINLMAVSRDLIRDAGLGVETDNKTYMEFTNGCEMYALPGSEKNVRGFYGVTLLVVDEAAYTSNSLYHTIEPMVAISGGQTILLSTPAGKIGYFYDIFSGDDERWERYRVTAYDCPRYDPEWLEWKRQTVPEDFWKREYLAEFTAPVNAVFNPDDIEAMFIDEEPPDVEDLLSDEFEPEVAI